MKEILKEAILGGFIVKNKHLEEDVAGNIYSNYYSILMDADFWKAIGKASGGSDTMDDLNKHRALRFHEINLTKGLEKAVEYLKTLIEK